MKKKSRATLLLAILAVAFVVALAYYRGPSATTISISNIYVDAGGTIADGKLTGSYWNIVAAVTANDDLAGVKLLENTNRTADVEGILQQAHAGADIEIKIDPSQPYLIRKIKRVDVLVTPLTYRAWWYRTGQIQPPAKGEADASAVTLSYYTWDEPSFRIYAPFTITVLKEGTVIGTKELNTEGASSVQTVETSEGTIRIENLGGLMGSYLAPDVPVQIAFFGGTKNYVYDWTQCSSYVPYDVGAEYVEGSGLINYIRSGTSDAYSIYWYGNKRWKPSVDSAQSPAGTILDWENYGGWIPADDTWAYKRDPIAPVIFPTDKSALPSNKRAFYCLTEYIEHKGVANLADGLFQQWQSWEINTNEFYVKINVPWSAYQVPLVNFRIPTEMADTWVDMPPISNVEVTATWLKTGDKTIDALNSERIKVDLNQRADRLSACKVVATVDNAKAHVYPGEMTVPSIAPNATATVYFDLSNSGSETESSFVVTIVAYETYANTETSRDTVSGKLLINVGQEESLLSIEVVEKGTTKPLVGIHVQIVYPPGTGTQKDGYTKTDGTILFLCSGSGTSGYTGDVQVMVSETTKYKEFTTVTHVSPGVKELKIELELKREVPPPDWSWLYVVMGIAVAATVFTLFVYKNRKKIKG